MIYFLKYTFLHCSSRGLSSRTRNYKQKLTSSTISVLLFQFFYTSTQIFHKNWPTPKSEKTKNQLLQLNKTKNPHTRRTTAPTTTITQNGGQRIRRNEQTNERSARSLLCVKTNQPVDLCLCGSVCFCFAFGAMATFSSRPSRRRRRDCCCWAAG